MSEYIAFHDPERNAEFVHAGEVDQALGDARTVWSEMRNIAMATTCADGDPHITVLGSGLPVPGPDDADYATGFAGADCWFWSFPDTLHVANTRINPVVKFAIFSSSKDIGALYVKAIVGEVPPEEIDDELLVLNGIRKARGIGPPRLMEEFDPTIVQFPKLLFVARGQQLTIPVRGYTQTGSGFVHSTDLRLPVQLSDVWPLSRPSDDNSSMG